MRILLIEDDGMIGAAVRAGLVASGFSVDWVLDGAVRSGIDRAQRLVEQLLRLSRVEPDAPMQQPQRCDLAALVREAVSLRSVEAEHQVIDNGPGIAPDERERVFDRFYRGEGLQSNHRESDRTAAWRGTEPAPWPRRMRPGGAADLADRRPAPLRNKGIAIRSRSLG